MAGDIRNYVIVTSAYWGFTLTDGALRMLVLLHFHTLGYTPFELAMLFLLYEAMGMATNLLGGWIGSRFGLKLTLYCGLSLQVAALMALSALNPEWPKLVSVLYVLCAQGLSGIAKDLTKMSSKSAIKLIVAGDQHSLLFRWVALLTGSKNALKGIGFFLGAFLLATLGFAPALWLMAACLAAILVAAIFALPGDMGISKTKTKFSQLLSKSPAINMLSAARVFLFGARDVWFVVGLPVFLYDVLGWTFTEVGGFLALWVIAYGFVQGLAPVMIKRSSDGRTSEIRAAQVWVFALSGVTAAIALALHAGFDPAWTLIIGLGVFGFLFAVNSAVHSYLILALTSSDQVALNVGFYYMANAAGRLAGTLLSGIAYQSGGIVACLLAAAAMLALSGLFALALAPASRALARDAEDKAAVQSG
jgi:predicted MFS family arabinose efflux permease